GRAAQRGGGPGRRGPRERRPGRLRASANGAGLGRSGEELREPAGRDEGRVSDVLERILVSKRTRLGRGEYSSGSKLSPRAATNGARFVASVSEPGPRIIAEIKAKSPSAGEILPGADGKVETFALLYRRGRAAAISVVVEEDHFGGRPEWLPRAKDVSGLP